MKQQHEVLILQVASLAAIWGGACINWKAVSVAFIGWWLGARADRVRAEKHIKE